MAFATFLSNILAAIPIANGELALGTWQALYLWEHRAHAHTRNPLLTVQN